MSVFGVGVTVRGMQLTAPCIADRMGLGQICKLPSFPVARC